MNNKQIVHMQCATLVSLFNRDTNQLPLGFSEVSIEELPLNVHSVNELGGLNCSYKFMPEGNSFKLPREKYIDVVINY